MVIGGTGTDDPAQLAEADILTPDSGELLPGVGGTGPEGPLASAELWTSATRPAKCLGKRPTLIARPGVALVGTPGNDVIAGSVGDDIISGGGGNDRICGHGGADTIDGGGGNDRIHAGPGADMVIGAGSRDRLVGGRGDDTLDGGKGRDVCIGGKGIDRLPACNEKRATRGTLDIRRNTTLAPAARRTTATLLAFIDDLS